MHGDDSFWISLVLLAVAYVVAVPAIAILALTGVNRQRDEIARLRNQVLGLIRRLDDSIDAKPAAAKPQTLPEKPRAPAPAAQAAQTATAPPAPPPPPGQPAGDGASAWRGLEESITSRWLVWLGGITLALAGAFLVKYSAEQGWLGPGVRVTLGALMGAALVVGGEWLRRQPLQKAIASLQPNYVPPALTAGGLFTAFASIYAAYGLYDLIPSLVAFVLLAAVAFGAVGLAVLQGPLIAVLGLIGGFVTPLLVSTGSHSVWELFSYLLFLVGGSLAVVRYMAWWWLAWAALAGAVVWPLLWFAAAWIAGDALPLGLYLVLLGSLFLFFRHGQGATLELVTWRRGLATLAVPEQVAWGAAAAVTLLTFMLVRTDSYGAVSLLALAALAGLFIVVGYREAVFDGLVVAAAALTTALMALWHLPAIVQGPEPLYIIEGRGYGEIPGPIVPPELLAYLSVTAGFAALFGVVGFFALWGARRPAIWAGVSAATPVILFAVAYWRIVDFGVDLKWSLAALALAGAFLTVASRVQSYRSARSLDLELGCYAAATVAAITLAAAMLLEEAWLTVAIALQLPALAWIHDRLSLKPMRSVALVLAGVVLIRLVFNVHILDYPLGSVPGFNWVLYGYGIPALAFWYAAKRFRVAADDRLVMVLEAGTLAFIFLLISFQIRNLIAGSLTSEEYRLLEQGAQASAWLALAYGCLVQYRRHRRVVLLWGWRILAGLSAAQTLFLQLLGSNPLWSGESVGSWPILDVLLPAYLLPAVFSLMFAWQLKRAGEAKLAALTAIWGLGLLFVYISLEVRHLFQGPVLSYGVTTNAEMYSYSVAWLTYALGLLAVGMYKKFSSVRHAALVILLVAVAKVFLFDMAALEGLYRVASFLGLGLSLVGIGYFYQKLVFPPGRPETLEAAGT